MSEFKFACPVCGQHITCDSASSGTQMDCPTCFRKLVVPQAKAADSPNLVLTASEVSKRTVPLPGNGQNVGNGMAPTRTTVPTIVIALGVLVVCAAGAGVFVFREKIFQADSHSPGTANQPSVVAKPVIPVIPPAADATNWTLNLREATIPDLPANGAVNGRGFKLERATIQQGRLDLRQGPKWPPDVGISVHLHAERTEDLAGRTVTIEATRTNSPRTILRWKNEQGEPTTKEYRQGYALKVEFGQVTNQRLPGKIFIAFSDEPKSYAAGTFSAEIRRPSSKK